MQAASSRAGFFPYFESVGESLMLSVIFQGVGKNVHEIHFNLALVSFQRSNVEKTYKAIIAETESFQF